MFIINVVLSICVFLIIDIVFTFLQVVALKRTISIFALHNILFSGALTFIIYCFYFGVI